MHKTRKQKKQRKIGYAAIGIAASLFLVYFLAFNPLSPFNSSTTTPTDGNSSFKLISYIDGEDVSDFVEISIWIPDSNADFDSVEEIYTWSEFEEEESSKDAEDVSIDLSGYKYVWLEIDPDAEQVFANQHYLITPAGQNRDYTYYAYHQSSDVNFATFDNTSAPAWFNFTIPDGATNANLPFGIDYINAIGAAPTAFPLFAIGENMTIAMNAPEYTHANTHHGTNWGIEQTDYDDFTTSELEFHHDEANWRAQAPVYVPADDLIKSGETSGLESVTDAFCIRWTYNTTVSTTDAATTQVNMTITDNSPAEIVIDGTFIYMIFYDTIDFEAGSFITEIEYEEGHRIYATAVQSGRIVVPRGSQSLGAFTAYSTVGL